MMTFRWNKQISFLHRNVKCSSKPPGVRWITPEYTGPPFVPMSCSTVQDRMRKDPDLQSILPKEELEKIFTLVGVSTRQKSLDLAAEMRDNFKIIGVDHCSHAGLLEPDNITESIETFMSGFRFFLRRAKFSELSGWEKYTLIYRKEGRKSSNHPILRLLGHTLLDYLSPDLQVDSRVSRFHKVGFWIRGEGDCEYKNTSSGFYRNFLYMMKKKIDNIDVVEEPMKIDESVIMLLHHKIGGDFQLQAFTNVPSLKLANLIDGVKVRIKGMDYLFMSSALFFLLISYLVQKVRNFGVFGHLNLTWHTTILLAAAITMVSGYFQLTSKKNEYYLRLAHYKISKNIASNDALLVYLVNEAEEETVKEVLLTLVGILNRGESQMNRLTVFGIETNTTGWLEREFNLGLSFKTSPEALDILEESGLITRSKHLFNLNQNAERFPTNPIFPIVVEPS